MQDSAAIKDLISSFRTITEKDAITPENVGYLLDQILQLSDKYRKDTSDELSTLGRRSTPILMPQSQWELIKDKDKDPSATYFIYEDQ